MCGNGIEIRTGPEEPERARKRPAEALLFLVAGMFGLVSFFHSMRGIAFSAWAVYGVTGALCWLTWYLYYGKRKYFLLYAFFFAAACWLAVLAMGERLGEQLRGIAACLADRGAEEAVAVTEAAVLLSALATFFVALAEFLLRGHEVLCLLATALIFLSPLLGIRAGVFAMLMLALFQAAFLVMQAARSAGGKVVLAGTDRHGLSGRSGIAAAGVLLAAFFAAYPAACLGLEQLYACACDVEGRVYRALLLSSGRAQDPVAGGRINRGNNYHTGTAQLEVETSAKLKDILYLRGFCGGGYAGGEWAACSDGELLAGILDKNYWQIWENTANIRFNGMYYLLTQNLLLDPLPRSVSVTIRHYGGAFDSEFVPYYSIRSRRYLYDQWDDFWYDYGYGNTREGYVYRCYERQDVAIDWEAYRSNFAADRDWFREMQDAYMEEIRTAYTAVPEEILPRLARLCQENPLEDLDEITAFILSTLQDRASYTLTPGWAPLNEDIVEYFLFESGRGYCEHFAAAAALMYRFYGVPARYAAGYMLQPADFTEQENGGWKAVATDEEAHAWVEIFLENYGWVPVEVTPAADGSIAASYPGFDSAVLGRILEERGWDRESPEGALPAEGAGAFPEEGALSFWDFPEIDWARWGKWLPVPAACAVYTLCLLPLFLDYRRLRKLRELDSAGCRRVFARAMRMLEFSGAFGGYDGTEEDFAGALGRAVSLPEEDVARMQNIVSEAAYGEGDPKPEDEAYVRRMYGRLAQAAWGKLKWHRRLVFRYWKGFY